MPTRSASPQMQRIGAASLRSVSAQTASAHPDWLQAALTVWQNWCVSFADWPIPRASFVIRGPFLERPENFSGPKKAIRKTPTRLFCKACLFMSYVVSLRVPFLESPKNCSGPKS